MNNEITQTKRLREAIFRHSWAECYEEIQSLLEKMSTKAFDMIARQAILYLAKFHLENDAEPFIKFMYSIIMDTTKRSTLQLYSVAELQEYNENRPGFGNFVTATNYIWRSIELHNQSQTYSATLAKAIVEIILADFCYYWARIHPEEWRTLHIFWTATTDEFGNVILPEEINRDRDKLDISINFQLQPESLAYQAAKWSHVADEIDVYLAFSDKN